MYVPDATSPKRPRVALVGGGQRNRHLPNLTDSMLVQVSKAAYLGRMPVVGYWAGDERDMMWEQDSSRTRWRSARFPPASSDGRSRLRPPPKWRV